MRKLGYAVVGLLLVAGLLPVVAVGVVQVTHRRDESGYLDYLRTYGGLRGTNSAPAPAAELLIAEGDRACDWLDGQPWALWRTDLRFRIPRLEDQYGNEVGSRPLGWTGGPDHGAITAGAWAYLCPAAAELREPHDLIGATSD